MGPPGSVPLARPPLHHLPDRAHLHASSRISRTADHTFPGEQFHARAAQQRHNIIPNRVALVSEESVSVVTVGTAPTQTETPPMRIYIIGNDGITSAASRRRQ